MTDTNQDNIAKNNGTYPHVGEFLANYIRKLSIKRPDLAYKIGKHPTSIVHYLKADTLQFKILWDLSIALKYNLLAELSSQLPTDVVEIKKSEREIELENELEKVKFELAVYKNIVGK